MTEKNLINLPGLVDAHVHLRVPGGEHKEDFRTGTAAALAGGFTMLMAMPNTNPPLVNSAVWSSTQKSADKEALCDVRMFCGATMDSSQDLSSLADIAPALKLYLDPTYGQLKVDGWDEFECILKVWPKNKPLALHAEGESIQMGIRAAESFQRPVHFCHISRREEIEEIAAAKERGLPVTCEVTPHHLFLTREDAKHLKTRGDMRPRLAGQDDVDALWEHINTTVDMVATDHAPHTLAEKEGAQNPPPGVPGLESSLPLMLTAVAQKRLTLKRLVALMYINPRRIYKLPAQMGTWIEVDTQARYTFPEKALYTKCGWTPFSGRNMQGRITRVVLNDREVMRDGIVHDIETN